MKVAVFHLAFVYSGGGEKLVLKEVEGLKNLGHKVDVYACVVNKKKCFPDLISKFKVKEFLPWAKFLLYGHESFQVILSCVLAPFFIFKFKDYDVILAANQPSLWIAYLCKLFLSKNYVGYLAQPTRFLYPRKIDKQTGLHFVKRKGLSFSVFLMNLFSKTIKKLDMLSVRGADLVLVNGEYMTGVIGKVYRVKAINCPAGAEYLSKPISFKRRKEGDLKVNSFSFKKPYILMTNRHVWQKRFEYGLTAFSGLLSQCDKYSLVITGSESEYTEELKTEVERLGLSGKVIFTGFVKDNDIGKLYKNASCYLYTAPQEDFGMGVVEAMGMGIPVVSWNDGGPGYTNVDGRTGILVEPYNTEEFTKSLITIVSDGRLSLAMAKNGISRVKSDFSWKKHFSLLQDSLSRFC